MMSHTVLVLAALIAMAPVPPASAASPQPLLVTPAALRARLAARNLVILHVGERATYEAGHIPGARFVDFQHGLHGSDGGLTLQMLPADVLRGRLAALGISDDSEIVVYASDRWFSPATRVVLTLQYAGLRAVSLLDGGIDAWIAAKQEVTADVPSPRAGTLAPLTLKPVVVDAEAVRAAVGKSGIAIVDGRAAAFYDGVQTGGGGHRSHATGHIAGARSVPFNTLTTADGRLKPVEELRAIFAAAGVRPGDKVIGYCHIGQQATAMLFAARLLGHEVALYDGSFEDWSARGLPVETSAAKR